MICKIVGLDKVIARLNALVPEAQKLGQQALTAELSGVLAASRLLVPFESGVLEGTGRVYPARVSGPNTVIAVGYGEGGAEAYALIQHENLSYQHASGKGPKYLEHPLTAWTNGGPAKVGGAIHQGIR
jgi:hypothetical protein